LKKKGEEELDDDQDSSNETGDKTDPGLTALDKTGATDISDLSEEDEVSDKPQTLIDKIKSKIIPKKKSAAAADDDGTDVHDVKKAPKKKINPVLLVVVLAVIGIVLFYEEEPEQVAQPVLQPRPKRVKKTEAAKTETPAAEPTTETPAVTDTPPATEPTTEPAPEPTPEEPAMTETPTTEPSPEPTTEEPAVTETPPATEPTTTEEPAVTDTPPATEPTPEEPAVTDTPSAEPTSPDSVDGQVTDTDESNMTDKILEDLEKQVKKDQPKEVKKEYVTPPDYEYKGRGLVYNCAGKHWACVDGPSYKTCEDNFSSTTFQKKTVECYPFNVYDTKKSCELMQNRVVSSNAKTGFCNGN
jgi:cytoskeletal protein RodZ